MQALYQMEMAGKGVVDALAEFEAFGSATRSRASPPSRPTTPSSATSSAASCASSASIDRSVDEALAAGWPLTRIEAVLRAILRAGAYELMLRQDVPARVTISEYVDVAHGFYGDEEPGLVNAVLDTPRARGPRRANSTRSRPGGRDIGPSAMTRPSEDELIARYFAPLAGERRPRPQGRRGPPAPPAGYDLVLTADALVAGVHFFADDPPGSIARKALGVNVSDLAAKGAEPLGFLLSPRAARATGRRTGSQPSRRGSARRPGTSACPLLGGDTVKRLGALTLAITAFGPRPGGADGAAHGGASPGTSSASPARSATPRSGTGAPRSATRSGRPSASRGDATSLLDRYLHPQPRHRPGAGLCAPMPGPRWTSRTASSAISPR